MISLVARKTKGRVHSAPVYYRPRRNQARQRQRARALMTFIHAREEPVRVTTTMRSLALGVKGHVSLAGAARQPAGHA
ncbi:hypothetical protein CCZ28_18455 [Pseudomonas oryzihabitans]|nr:hypothetical protein CCZ28_18455 [Pseudomonas psychrotolerans]